MSDYYMTTDEEIVPAEYATLSPTSDIFESTTEQMLYDPFTKAEDDFIRKSYQGCLAQGILYSDHMMFVANELHRPYAAVCDRLLELNTLHRKNRPQMQPIALPDFTRAADHFIWSIFLKYNDPDSPHCKGNKFNAQKGEIGAMAKRLNTSQQALLLRLKALLKSYKSKTSPNPVPASTRAHVVPAQNAPVDERKILELSSLCAAIVHAPPGEEVTGGYQQQRTSTEGSTTRPSLPSSSCSTEEQFYPAQPLSCVDPAREQQNYPPQPSSFVDSIGEQQCYPPQLSSCADSTGEHQYYPAQPSSCADSTGEQQDYPAQPLSCVDPAREQQNYPPQPSSFVDSIGEQQCYPPQLSSCADSTGEQQYYPAQPSSCADSTGEQQDYPPQPSSCADSTGEQQYYPPQPSSCADSTREQQYYPAPPPSFTSLTEAQYFPALLAPCEVVAEPYCAEEPNCCYIDNARNVPGEAPTSPLPKCFTPTEDQKIWNVYLAHYGADLPPAQRQQVSWKLPPDFIAALMDISQRSEAVLVARVRTLLQQYQWQKGMFKHSTPARTVSTVSPTTAAISSAAPTASVPPLAAAATAALSSWGDDSIWEMPVSELITVRQTTPRYKEMQASLPEQELAPRDPLEMGQSSLLLPFCSASKGNISRPVRNTTFMRLFDPPTPTNLAAVQQLTTTTSKKKKKELPAKESVLPTPARRSTRKRRCPETPIVDTAPTLYNDPGSGERDDSTFHTTSQLSICPRSTKRNKAKMYTAEEDAMLWTVHLESQQQKIPTAKLLRPVAEQLNRPFHCVKAHLTHIVKKGSRYAKDLTSTANSPEPPLPRTPAPTPIPTPTPTPTASAQVSIVALMQDITQACDPPVVVIPPPPVSSSAVHSAQGAPGGGESALSHTLSAHSEDTHSQSLSSLSTAAADGTALPSEQLEPNPLVPSEETDNYWAAAHIPQSAMQDTQEQWYAEEISSMSHSCAPLPEVVTMAELPQQLPSAIPDHLPVQPGLPHQLPSVSPDHLLVQSRLLQQLPSAIPDHLPVQPGGAAEVSSATAPSTFAQSIPFLTPINLPHLPPALAAMPEAETKNILSFSPVEDAYLFSEIHQALATHSFSAGTLEDIPIQLGRSKEVVLQRAVTLLHTALGEMLRQRVA